MLVQLCHIAEQEHPQACPCPRLPIACRSRQPLEHLAGSLQLVALEGQVRLWLVQTQADVVYYTAARAVRCAGQQSSGLTQVAGSQIFGLDTPASSTLMADSAQVQRDRDRYDRGIYLCNARSRACKAYLCQYHILSCQTDLSRGAFNGRDIKDFLLTTGSTFRYVVAGLQIPQLSSRVHQLPFAIEVPTALDACKYLDRILVGSAVSSKIECGDLVVLVQFSSCGLPEPHQEL